MINEKILEHLKEKDLIRIFFEDLDALEILYKNLTLEDIERLNKEYPGLLQLDNINISSELIISTLTFISKNLLTDNYIKIKKIKIYFDELKAEIIKILQN